MAASDDFPRGWILTVTANAGVTAIATVPAAAGITHVLDSFYCEVEVAAAGGAYSLIMVNPAITLSVLPVPTAPEAITDSQSVSIAAPVGQALVVEFSAAAPAGGLQFLRIIGHDI